MILYRTPGRSFTRPPRTSTIECSCRLWPTPGMYAVTSIWLVSLTRATLRSAELGFFGVVVYTRVHTPRRCGLPLRAGVLVLLTLSWRPLRTSCWIVGTGSPNSLARYNFAGGIVTGLLTTDALWSCCVHRPPRPGVSSTFTTSRLRLCGRDPARSLR